MYSAVSLVVRPELIDDSLEAEVEGYGGGGAGGGRRVVFQTTHSSEVCFKAIHMGRSR